MKAIVIFLLSLLSFSASANLSQQQIHAIQNGWHAPFSQATIDKVASVQKYIPPEKEFYVEFDIPKNYWQEPADKWMWALFWGVQIADIYSTHEGIKYDCVKEANPLLPEIPTISQMVFLKGVVLLPTYEAIGYENITKGDLVAPMVLSALVVNNNLRVTDRAERRCNLR